MDVGRARDQMPTLELAKLPNVIATPHIGGLTPPAIESQSLETVGQVEAIINGKFRPAPSTPIAGPAVLERLDRHSFDTTSLSDIDATAAATMIAATAVRPKM